MQPELLYQYLPEPKEEQQSGELDSADIIRRCRFKLSTIGSLNDPFDMVPVLPEKMHPQDVRNYLEGSRTRYPQIGEVTPLLVAKVKARFDEVIKAPHHWWRSVANRGRIICLSARPDGILLWSHYASRHCGFVVGFRRAVLLKSEPQCDFFEVEYLEERVVLSLLDFVYSDSGLKMFRELWGRKSPEWKYECEWRALLRKDELPDSRFHAFNPDAIASLVLGPDISPESELALKEACTEIGIVDSVEVKRATLSRHLFQIDVVDSQWKV